MVCFEQLTGNVVLRLQHWQQSRSVTLAHLCDVLYKTKNLFQDSKSIHIYPYLQWCSSTMHAEKRSFTDSIKIIIEGNKYWFYEMVRKYFETSDTSLKRLIRSYLMLVRLQQNWNYMNFRTCMWKKHLRTTTDAVVPTNLLNWMTDFIF